jgi:hypothetical protein
MKKFTLVLIVLLLSATGVISQNLSVQSYDPPIQVNGAPDWGLNLVVSNTEPLGMPGGIYRASTNMLYVAVPDTNAIAGKCIVLYASSNNGTNWVILNSISPATIVPKVKMVRSGLDSVYCFFLYGTTVYSWNIISNNMQPFTAYVNIRDFDAEASSTGSLYLIVDLNTNNDIRLYGSSNGGAAWAGAVFLSSTGASPKWYKSGMGDTLLIAYYGVLIQPDTATSAIRTVRYRESAPGTLTLVGAFATPLAAGVTRMEFKPVLNGSNAWLFFTTGTTGNIDLNCMVSTNNGVAFGTAFTVNSVPGRDEYWFDAKHWNSGVDVIYYSDSLQAGPPTNITDKLMYCSASNTTPSTFLAPTQISQNPPGWSLINYKPSIIEYLNVSGDLAPIWVGITGSSKKLYINRLFATKIRNNETEVPAKYFLGQNYPNPFNPTTKINFAIPKSGLVMIKVYDIAGREMAEIVNQVLTSGSYTVDFDGAILSSGAYFYKITSGNFTETKKMLLIR